jgi:hypothetical protein
MEEISFQDSYKTSPDGWREFSIKHCGGVHTLSMCYASQFCNPCRIRIDGKEMWVSVATQRTGDNDVPTWFEDEGTFDLGDAPGTTTSCVGFKPASSQGFPNIRAFRFVPELRSNDTRDFLGRGSFIDDTGDRWRKSPTAVTFTFEIGVPSKVMALERDTEYMGIYLPGKAIKFRFGEAHDAVSIDGDPIGRQHGGDSFPKVSFYEQDDFISSMSLGLSTYSGEGAFHGLTLEKRGTSGTSDKSKRILVGAKLVEPTWTYDCQKLGLNLWITSLAAPIHKPVSRYGFTLSSDDLLDYNPLEFRLFCEWLVEIKCKMANYEQSTVEVEDVRSTMQPLFNFLEQSFSCLPLNPNSIEGYLYGSKRHVSIYFDVFSIYIYRLPDGETFQSTLFVDGKQFNTKKKRMEEIQLRRNDILAFAISVALQDTDLLFQMGLIELADQRSKEELELDEVELVPLKSGTTLFLGDYSNTVMARRAVTLLALAGLRKVSYETVMDDSEAWDVYDVGAGAACGIYSKDRQLLMELGAVLCALIQLVVPAFLIYRGLQQETGEITWDVCLARLFFGMYAIFYEAKTWDVDNGDRVTGWLCFLPEFSQRKLIVGMLVNKVSKVVVSAAIVILMLRSFTVFDVTLNALALYFILDVDDELVDDRTLEDFLLYQRQELFILKSKTALEYRLPFFDEDELPKLQDLPVRYFRVASNRFSTTVTIAFLFLGCLWMLAEPFVLGYTWE